MSYNFRINLGIRDPLRGCRTSKQEFANLCLGAGDMIEWLGGTAVVHTNEPDDVLDAMLEHGYSVMEDGSLRWMNVGPAETE